MDFLFIYVIQHCFICRPSDSTVSEDAGIEPRTLSYIYIKNVYMMTNRLDWWGTKYSLSLVSWWATDGSNFQLGWVGGGRGHKIKNKLNGMRISFVIIFFLFSKWNISFFCLPGFSKPFRPLPTKLLNLEKCFLWKLPLFRKFSLGKVAKLWMFTFANLSIYYLFFGRTKVRKSANIAIYIARHNHSALYFYRKETHYLVLE